VIWNAPKIENSVKIAVISKAILRYTAYSPLGLIGLVIRRKRERRESGGREFVEFALGRTKKSRHLWM